MIYVETMDTISRPPNYPHSPSLIEKYKECLTTQSKISKVQIVAHRGKESPGDVENNLKRIDELIKLHPDWLFEVDVYYDFHRFLIGHDKKKLHGVDLLWLLNNASYLLIHCKNLEAYEELTKFKNKFNCNLHLFMHDADPIGISNQNWIVANYDVIPDLDKVIFHPHDNDPPSDIYNSATGTFKIMTGKPLEWEQFLFPLKSV